MASHNEAIRLADLVAAQRGIAAKVGAFGLDPVARRLSSLRCAVGFAARAHEAQAVAQGRRTWRAWMVTVTYAQAGVWEPSHWQGAIHAMREWARRQGFPARYVWVAEIQTKRLARTGESVIHYHAVVWLPQGVRMPKWDVRGWWKHGRCQRVLVRKSAVGYLMKYLSKGSEITHGHFPRGARVYGVGGLARVDRLARRWLRLPSFVQGNSSIYGEWSRGPGGGWISPEGARIASEFRRVLVAGRGAMQRVAVYGRSIVAHGPFCWLTDKALA